MKNIIFQSINALVDKYHTRDPFELLEHLHVVVKESDSYKSLKGYCLMSCRTIYVVLSASLSEEEKRMVAAHELGHIILHRKALQMAPMKDIALYDMTNSTEYEANLFAADLLIEDSEVERLSQETELDFFGMCSCLNVNPHLMSFKLFSLIKRGFSYQMPIGLNSRFFKSQG